jgi:tripartite-type tricarboxylate transporter receptor subunit TctC
LCHTAPSSAADVYARELARILEADLGQPVAVVNRVGGNGLVQMTALAAAPADGYTLGVNTVSHLSILRTIARQTYKLSDFAWITRIQLETFLTVVRADSPWQTLQEFVAAARSASPALNIGGQGAPGSAHNIHMNILAQSAGFKFNWVPFQGGIEQLTALLGGTLVATSNNPQTIVQFAEVKRVRPLGVLSDQRLGTFPDVPTYREAGYEADTAWNQVRGLIARAGTPTEVQQRLVQAIRRGIENDGWKRYMKESSLLDGFQDTQEYTAFIAKQDALTEHWLKTLGLLK